MDDGIDPQTKAGGVGALLVALTVSLNKILNVLTTEKSADARVKALTDAITAQGDKHVESIKNVAEGQGAVLRAVAQDAMKLQAVEIRVLRDAVGHVTSELAQLNTTLNQLSHRVVALEVELRRKHE